MEPDGLRVGVRRVGLAATGVPALAALTLTVLAGCRPSAPAGRVAPAPAAFPAGSTMARLHQAGRITIGSKFDQPGFGLAGPHGRPAGFDVEIGKIVAAELGIPAERIAWVETPARVLAALVDPVLVSSALDSILDNAVKFSPPAGEVAVLLAEEGETVRIDVIDGGPGLGETDLAHLGRGHDPGGEPGRPARGHLHRGDPPARRRPRLLSRGQGRGVILHRTSRLRHQLRRW